MLHTLNVLDSTFHCRFIVVFVNKILCVFRRVRELRKAIISFIMSVCLFVRKNGTAWVPLDGCS
jgi:hypothetical protein